MQRRTGLDKPALFKDIREQTVVYAVVIAYYWKFYVHLAELLIVKLETFC